MRAEADPQGGAALDGLVERLGRWTAARTTRRSFLGRAGRVAVLVAAGPAAVATLTDAPPASARVCGQSGVAPKCATYDCGETWGWCWYASGCCAGGRLKKICDCCAPNTPNPRGYCPYGTEVLCIVESCNADPRLMTRALHRVAEDDPVRIAVAVSRWRYPTGTVPIAVIGDAESDLHAAVAVALGRTVGGPVLLTPRGTLDGGVADELARLRVEFVKVVGPALDPAAVDRPLAARGIAVERLGTSTDPSAFSAEVAAWAREMTGARTALVVTASGAGLGLAPAAALANARRLPLLVGGGAAVERALREPRPVHTTYVVAGDPAEAGAYPAGRPVSGGSRAEVAAALADVALALGVGADLVALASSEAPRSALAAATIPAPLVLHAPGSMEGAFVWLLDHRAGIRAVTSVGGAAVLTSAARYSLQSVINEFDAHLLVGQAGEGLPVIPQPVDERPIGMARR